MPIKSQILTCKKLRRKNNLPRVSGKVFHHMKQRLDARHIIFLNPILPGKSLTRQARNNRNRFLHRIPEISRQIGRRRPARRRELTIPDSTIGPAAEPGNNPLPHIPGKMQRKVPNRILIRVPAHPNLIVR